MRSEETSQSGNLATFANGMISFGNLAHEGAGNLPTPARAEVAANVALSLTGSIGDNASDGEITNRDWFEVTGSVTGGLAACSVTVMALGVLGGPVSSTAVITASIAMSFVGERLGASAGGAVHDIIGNYQGRNYTQTTSDTRITVLEPDGSVTQERFGVIGKDGGYDLVSGPINRVEAALSA